MQKAWGMHSCFDRLRIARANINRPIRKTELKSWRFTTIWCMKSHESFFLHYCGVGPAEKLVTGLRAALLQTGKTIEHTEASVFPDFKEVLCKNNLYNFSTNVVLVRPVSN